MTDITFDTAHGDNGRVLLIQFPYDETVIERIKSMPKDTTQWGYHDPDFENTPLDIDDKVWYIAHTQPAIRELENTLSVTVPTEHRPTPDTPNDSEPDSITLHVANDSTEFTVEPVTDRILSLLDAEFSYRDPDAHFSDAYQNGHWDGKHHLFDTDTATAPIGLLHDTKTFLVEHEYEPTIEWEHKQRGSLIDTSWSFEHSLRGYQRDTSHALISNHGGIASLPDWDWENRDRTSNDL